MLIKHILKHEKKKKFIDLIILYYIYIFIYQSIEIMQPTKKNPMSILCRATLIY